MILLVFALSALVAPGRAAATDSAAQFEVVELKDVMVPMRDGVRLATDIYLPALHGAPAPGRFPVLLSRTPYGKTPSLESPYVRRLDTGHYFAERGYAVLIQDCRGRYNSQGRFYIDVNEGPDGYDTVEWAARQPWSNGKVGTYGGSYLAQVQNALAVLRPPHLAAMFVMVGTSNYYEEGSYRGGAFALLHNLVYALRMAATGEKALADPVAKAALSRELKQQIGTWLRAYPFRPNASPLVYDPDYQLWFQDFVDHPYYDNYWKQNGFNFEVSYDKYPDIPIDFVSGWYDLFLRGTLHNYTGLATRRHSPTKLLVGPWVHAVGPRSSGDVDFGPGAQVDLRLEQRRWFDQVLKGLDTGILRDSPVRLFVMGGGDGKRTSKGLMEDGGAWISTTAWPPPHVEYRPYYLRAGGKLSTQAPGSEPATSFEFDPTHPVPTIGGQIDSGKDFIPDGPRDQCCTLKIFGCENDLPLSARRDVLVFETPPLASDLTVAGPLSVNLWVSSSAPDTDFTAKLIDAAPPTSDYPGGFAMNLADRIIRVRTSLNSSRPELLRPGEIRNVTIDLLGVANRFEKGHRIRLDISSSNFPFFDINSNTGEPEGHPTHTILAVNSVYHDVDHPSRLVLPVMPQEVAEALQKQ